MKPQIIGISGSPIKNSNTDRIVQAVLDASGLETKFVKLSNITVGPCRACKLCVEDNICKVKDDFPALAEDLKKADAYVIGCYCPYSMIDAFTKAFLERLWSMRHVNNLNRGKLVVTSVTGMAQPIREMINRSLMLESMMEKMELLGQLEVVGNVPCLTCGRGGDCEMSGVRFRYGPDAEASADLCGSVESQEEVWNEALRLGQELGKRLTS